MSLPGIVMDTNVLVAALRSRQGASHRLLMLVGTGKFEVAVSVPLVLEYEAEAMKLTRRDGLTAADVSAIIDYLCLVAVRAEVHYLWRPFLRDPKDDMVLEAAVAAGCGQIVTFNRRDFAGSEQFGIGVVTPGAFLAGIGG